MAPLTAGIKTILKLKQVIHDALFPFVIRKVRCLLFSVAVILKHPSPFLSEKLQNFLISLTFRKTLMMIILQHHAKSQLIWTRQMQNPIKEDHLGRYSRVRGQELQLVSNG